MVRDLKIRNYRLAEPLDLDIFGIVLTDRNRRIDHLRDDHHYLCNLFFQLGLLSFQSSKLLGISLYLSLYLLSLVLFALFHKSTDLLGQCIPCCLQVVSLALGLASFLVESYYLVNKRKLIVLEFLFDVFLYRIRVFS